MNIQDMTALDRSAPCSKCGRLLWNDHGWILDDGSIVCRREDQCFSRIIANKIAVEKAAGIIPPWRTKGAANAKLIAAAPDLLAFAERIARLPPHGEYVQLIDEARAVIANAKGETTK